jgi:rubredoxin
MFKVLFLTLFLAVTTTDAFTIPTSGVSRTAFARPGRTIALHMSEEPKVAAEVSDPMEDEMEFIDDATLAAMEKQRRTQELREQEVFMTKSTGISKCTNCDWQYDQTKGDSMMIGGMVKPDTPFSDLPADWRCPVCRASKDAFQEIVEEIPGFEVNQGYGFGANTWTSGQKNLAVFGGLGFFFVLFLSGYAMS